jgi:hypothetical protein
MDTFMEEYNLVLEKGAKKRVCDNCFAMLEGVPEPTEACPIFLGSKLGCWKHINALARCTECETRNCKVCEFYDEIGFYDMIRE